MSAHLGLDIDDSTTHSFVADISPSPLFCAQPPGAADGWQKFFHALGVQDHPHPLSADETSLSPEMAQLIDRAAQSPDLLRRFLLCLDRHWASTYGSVELLVAPLQQLPLPVTKGVRPGEAAPDVFLRDPFADLFPTLPLSFLDVAIGSAGLLDVLRVQHKVSLAALMHVYRTYIITRAPVDMEAVTSLYSQIEKAMTSTLTVYCLPLLCLTVFLFVMKLVCTNSSYRGRQEGARGCVGHADLRRRQGGLRHRSSVRVGGHG